MNEIEEKKRLLRELRQEKLAEKVENRITSLFDGAITRIADTFNTLIAYSKEHDRKLERIDEKLDSKIDTSIKIEELKEVIEKKDFRGPRGPQGERGEKGDRGERGFSGKDGRDGKDGQDLAPMGADELARKLESLNGGDRLDASAIKNLEKQLRQLRGEYSKISDVMSVVTSGGGSGVVDPLFRRIHIQTDQPTNPKENDLWIQI